jgi:hypothetical protein
VRTKTLGLELENPVRLHHLGEEGPGPMPSLQSSASALNLWQPGPIVDTLICRAQTFRPSHTAFHEGTELGSNLGTTRTIHTGSSTHKTGGPKEIAGKIFNFKQTEKLQRLDLKSAHFKVLLGASNPWSGASQGRPS